MTQAIRYDDQVAIVTGAGNGLGKSHALLLASRGAKVVVNDLGGDIHGDGSKSSAAADAVVEEIKAAGGQAVANYDSVEDGEAIVQTALDAFGTVDIVINNAGILRDVSFAKMTDKDWDLIQSVHLRGSYKVSHAAWPIMREKGYGRIIMTTSAAGIYGNFGQANYSSAKLGLLGLANTLAAEGRKNNIHVNTIAPIAGSRLTETILPPDLLEKLKPEYVSPLVAWLCSKDCKDSGGLFEVGAGFIGKLRWQRASKGVFNTAQGLSPEQVAKQWKRVSDFEEADHPGDINTAMGQMLQAMNNPPKGGNEFIDLDLAEKQELVLESSYDERDLALYALGIGAARDPADEKERAYVYELANDFQAFPTYGVMPNMGAMLAAAKEGSLELPGMNFGFERLLHGEQFTEIKRPLPPSATLKHTFKVQQAWDKDPNAVVTFGITSSDVETGEELIYNEMTAFIKGAGGWGGERGDNAPVNVAPEREPDAVIEEQTDINQTLLYRLSGDWNPLHADPAFAKAFGFDKPILHGLCTFGYCGRHVVKAFANNDGRYFKNIKVRFAKSVYPGDTLVTRMWKDSDTRIIFETSVKERDEVVISNAAIELYEEIPVAEVQPVDAQQADAPGAAQVVEMLSSYVSQHPELVGSVGKVYQWHVQNPAMDFVLDLKNGDGAVTSGTAEHDCSIELDESDLMGMMRGEADAQKLYFAGKLKIAGDIMASQKLQFLADMDPAEVQAALQAGAAAAEAAPAKAASQPAAAKPAKELSSPKVFAALTQKLAEDASAKNGAAGVLQFNILDADQAWAVDFTDAKARVAEGEAAHPTTTFSLNDADLAALVAGKADVRDLHQRGQLRVDGDIRQVHELGFLTGLI